LGETTLCVPNGQPFFISKILLLSLALSRRPQNVKRFTYRIMQKACRPAEKRERAPCAGSRGPGGDFGAALPGTTPPLGLSSSFRAGFRGGARRFAVKIGSLCEL
jgi:hypothetical protein